MSLYLYLANKHFPELIDTQEPMFGRYLVELGQDMVKKRSTSFQGAWAMLEGWGSLGERFAQTEGGEKYFEFRLKPLHSGVYAVPPMFAEGMYDTNLLHRGLSGSVKE